MTIDKENRFFIQSVINTCAILFHNLFKLSKMNLTAKDKFSHVTFHNTVSKLAFMFHTYFL